MPETPISHFFSEAWVKRILGGIATALIALMTFLVKQEYTHIGERIDNNSTAVIAVREELVNVDKKYSVVRDEQMNRRGILDRLQADTKWLWSETDKMKADTRTLYDLVLKNTKAIEDETRSVREKQITGLAKIERLEERVMRLETLVLQLEQRVKQVEERVAPYRRQRTGGIDDGYNSESITEKTEYNRTEY